MFAGKRMDNTCGKCGQNWIGSRQDGCPNCGTKNNVTRKRWYEGMVKCKT